MAATTIPSRRVKINEPRFEALTVLSAGPARISSHTGTEDEDRIVHFRAAKWLEEEGLAKVTTKKDKAKKDVKFATITADGRKLLAKESAKRAA